VSVAVVIVNWNSEQYLGRCLESLQQQTLPPRRVVVIDNASPGGGAAAFREKYPQIQVVESARNVGFAAACNMGVTLSSDCEWIAFLNPDAFPDRTWLEILIAAAATHPDCASFGSRLMSAENTAIVDGEGDEYHVSGMVWRRRHGQRLVEVREDPTEIFSACAAAALYRREALVEVGGFDENLFCYIEDSDLGFRLRLRGYRCLYVPTAVVFHVGSVSTGKYSDFYVYQGHRNLVWVYLKNMPFALMLIYGWAHVLLNLASIAWYVLRGRGGVILRAKWHALREMPRVLRQRRDIQATKVVSAWQLRAVMARGVTGLLSRKWMTG
jgi:GT2 family glycosyltransferase